MWRLALIALLFGAGCSDDGTQLGTGAGGGNGSSSTGSGMMAELLPCEVSGLLSARCVDCHGEEPKFGALRTLITHDDLVASGDGHDTLAEASITRMELPVADEDRMPLDPRPPATSAEVAIIQDFVNAGLPTRAEDETCQ